MAKWNDLILTHCLCACVCVRVWGEIPVESSPGQRHEDERNCSISSEASGGADKSNDSIGSGVSLPRGIFIIYVQLSTSSCSLGMELDWEMPPERGGHRFGIHWPCPNWHSIRLSNKLTSPGAQMRNDQLTKCNLIIISFYFYLFSTAYLMEGGSWLPLPSTFLKCLLSLKCCKLFATTSHNPLRCRPRAQDELLRCCLVPRAAASDNSVLSLSLSPCSFVHFLLCVASGNCFNYLDWLLD